MLCRQRQEQGWRSSEKIGSKYAMVARLDRKLFYMESDNVKVTAPAAPEAKVSGGDQTGNCGSPRNQSRLAT